MKRFNLAVFILGLSTRAFAQEFRSTAAKRFWLNCLALILLVCIAHVPLGAQTTGTIAALVVPASNSVVDDSLVTFQWTSVDGAQAYYLYVGSAPGLKDAYDSGEVQVTSLSCILPAGTQYYVRMWTKISDHWKYADYTFSTGAGKARLLTPADGATDMDPLASFSWTVVPNVAAYYLYVGSAPGLADVFDSGEKITTSISVTGLQPLTQYYARIWTKKASGQWLWTDSIFTTGTGLARLTTPKDGATNVDPATVFSWSAIPDAGGYSLYIGTAPGARDLFTSGQTQALTISVPNLQRNKTYYARMWTLKQNTGKYVDSTFTTGTGLAHLTFPPDGSTNIDPASTFQWTAVPDAQCYFLYIGSSIGAMDIYGSGETQATSIQVPRLQAGQQYYARIWTQKNNQWYWIDSVFGTGTGIARLLSPADRATGVSPGPTFVWNTVADAQTYYLYVGTASGLKDVVDSGQLQSTSYSTNGLAPDTAYYARTWTLKSDGWHYVDSTFTTAPGTATLTYPAVGEAAANVFAPFTWNTINGAESYYLYVGTAPGAQDVFSTSALPSSVTSLTVSGMMPDTTYYARLWTETNGSWQYSDSSFHTAPPVNAYPDRAQFYTKIMQLTATVRAMADDNNMPLAGSPLAQEIAVWGRPNAVCSDFANVLLQVFAQNQIYARLTTLTFVGNYQAWHALTEYFDPFLQKWSVADPTFGLIYFDSATQQGQSAAESSQYVVAQDWASIKPLFVAPKGDQYMRSYYMDPILLFLNVVPQGAIPKSAAINPPDPFLQLMGPNAIGQPGIYLFYFGNNSKTALNLNNGGTEMVLTPLDSTNWSSIVAAAPGWSLDSDSDDPQIYTPKRVLF